jgi:uncharacterized protein (UPF0276 family)
VAVFAEILATTTLLQRSAPVSCHGSSFLASHGFLPLRLERLSFLLVAVFAEILATTTLLQRSAPVSCHGFSLSLLVTVFCRSPWSGFFIAASFFDLGEYLL